MRQNKNLGIVGLLVLVAVGVTRAQISYPGGGGGVVTNASNITSGTLANARLTPQAQYAIGMVIDIRNEGAVSGSGSDVTAINDANDTADAGGWIYFPPGVWTIDSSVTIDNPVMFDAGCDVQISTGCTFTMNGSAAAPTEAIFSGLGTAAIESGQTINVVWYTTAGNGDSDNRWVNGLRRAVDACGAGFYYMPAGIYEDASTVTIDADYVHIQGAGKKNTIIYYTQDDGTAAIEFDAGSSTPITYCSLSDLTIRGDVAGTPTDGIGLYLDDVAESTFQRLFIESFDNDANDAVGLKLAGWYRIEIVDLLIENCPYSVQIAPGDGHAGQDADMFVFRDCFFFPNDEVNGRGVDITGDILHNTLFENCQVVYSKYGVYWVQSLSTAIREFTWRGGRFEGSGSATTGNEYAFYLDLDGGAGYLGHFTVENFQSDVRMANLSGVKFVNFIDCKAQDSLASPSTSLVTDSTVKPLTMTNCEFLTGVTIGADMIWKRRGTGVSTAAMSGLWDTKSTGGDYQFGENVRHAILETDIDLTSTQAYTPVASAYRYHLVDVTVNDAGQTLSIENPTGAYPGMEFTVTIRNSTGGVLTNAPTWGNQYYIDSAGDPTKPAALKTSSLRFLCIDYSTYVEIGRSDNAWP